MGVEEQVSGPERRSVARLIGPGPLRPPTAAARFPDLHCLLLLCIITRMDLTTAEHIAKNLMAEHGLIAKGWTFVWDNTKRRIGQCRYGPMEIGLSAPFVLLNDEKLMRDTVLHEIAHALAGPGTGHGPQWKAIARSFGIKPSAYESDVTAPAGLWVGSCESCDFTIERHRLTDRSRNSACPECCKRHNGGRFHKDYRLSWRKNRLVA